MWVLGGFFGILLLVFASLNTPATALASPESDSITVSATVPPMNSVYVDGEMRIVKILSNTEVEAELIVLSSDSPKLEIPIDSSIYAQYLKIEQTHNLKRIGEVYNVDWEKRASSKKPASHLGRFKLNVFRVSTIF